MRTLDEIVVGAPPERVFALAADVERWPAFLSHYRWVRVLERRGPEALVEMAAWRPFGPLRYPTWWVSRMETHPGERAVRYRHVRGITSGMDVEWRLRGAEGGPTHVTIEHVWDGPRWPLVGGPVARWIIGPVFIHHIAGRTLAGIKREAET